MLLEGVGSNVNLLWTLAADGNEVTWGLNSTTDGYIGLGFPLEDSDNVMVGTNALLLQSCGSCATGGRSPGRAGGQKGVGRGGGKHGKRSSGGARFLLSTLSRGAPGTQLPQAGAATPLSPPHLPEE